MFHQSIRENEVSAVTEYAWDSQNRLKQVNLPDGSEHRYQYDYRTRRLRTEQVGGNQAEVHTAILFSGGLSVAEWEAGSAQGITLNGTPNVEYTRGPDMGGGVGGLLYSARTSGGAAGQGGAAGPSAAVVEYNLSNGRGDIVAQTDSSGALTWTASYEAFGKRTKETGQNQDKQRANSKDEAPTGLINEGFRYRDIETGMWLSRDPAGFVDGPNLYAYVKQNPWTKFDPLGLWGEAGHFYTTYAVALAAGVPQQRAFNLAYYSQIPDEVDRFDAIPVAENVGKATGVVVGKASANKSTFGYASGPTLADVTDVANKNAIMNSVQKGLHFLSGKNDAGVTKARSNLAVAIKSGEFSSDWETGFAIHTLGDTYAHSYDTGGGKQAGYQTGLGHLTQGKLPDHITSSAANTAKYTDYVTALYGALGGKGSAASNPDIAELLKTAGGLPQPFNRGTGHGKANDAMHEWFTGKYGKDAMNGYDPRPDHATSNSAGLAPPAVSDVDKHSSKTQKIIDR